MTISSESSSAIFLGNGSNTVFTFSFVADSASNIVVTYTDQSNISTVLDPSLYTLFINPPSANQIWGLGGVVTYPISGTPIANGTSLTVARILPLTQQITISDQGNFSPEVIEEGLDTLEMQIQQVSGRSSQFRGIWITNTDYNVGDIVQDGANGNSTGNYYICQIANTPNVWSSDLAAGDWALSATAMPPTGISTLTGDVTGSGFGTIVTTIAPSSVTGSKIASSTITNSNMAANSVDNPQIVNGAVTNAKITSSPAFTFKANNTNATASITDITIPQFGSMTFGYGGIGFVNRFRNGPIDGWTRGTSGTVTTAGGYTADGFIVTPTGASCTWQQTAGRSSTIYGLKVTGSTSVTDVTIGQRIESFLCETLYQGGSTNVTFQAKVYNNTGGSITPTLTIKHAGSQDNWGSPVTDVNAVSVQACPNTTLTQVAYTFASQSGTLNGLQAILDFGNNFSANTKTLEVFEWDIRATPNISVGINNSPPYPELRPIAIEGPINQRYLPSQTVIATGFFGFGGAISSSNAYAFIIFEVPARIAPTNVTFVGGTPAFSTATGSTTGSVIFQAATSTTQGVLTSSGASGLVAGNTSILQAGSGMTSLYWTGAEL